MVSTWPYPKIGQLRRCPPWVVPAAIAGFLFSPTWAVWLLTVIYLCLGPAIWMYGRMLEIRD
jgi:hypothetical protein